MVYILFDVNLLYVWFNVDIDILKWVKPALILTGLIIFIGESIAAIMQKCWVELIIGLILLAFALINMSNIFVSIPE